MTIRCFSCMFYTMDDNLQFGSITAVKAAIIQETKIITIYTNNFMVIKSDILICIQKYRA
jgi:hypothetical protein